MTNTNNSGSNVDVNDTADFMTAAAKAAISTFRDREKGERAVGTAVQRLAHIVMTLAEQPSRFTVAQGTKNERVALFNVPHLQGIHDDAPFAKDAKRGILAWLTAQGEAAGLAERVARKQASDALDFAHALTRVDYSSEAFDSAKGCFVLRDLLHMYSAPDGATKVERTGTERMRSLPLYVDRTTHDVAYVSKDGKEVATKAHASVENVKRALRARSARAKVQPRSNAQAVVTLAQGADAVANALSKAAGNPVTGEAADAIAVVIAEIASNDSLWLLAIAEREAYERNRKTGSDSNTAAAA